MQRRFFGPRYIGDDFFRADRSLGAKQEGLTIVHFLNKLIVSCKEAVRFPFYFFFAIFKLDSYLLFKLKGYFLYFTPIVHSMPKLRIHFWLVLIIYWCISFHTCCCLARILRCSLLIICWHPEHQRWRISFFQDILAWNITEIRASLSLMSYNQICSFIHKEVDKLHYHLCLFLVSLVVFNTVWYLRRQYIRITSKDLGTTNISLKWIQCMA